jgi:MFS transporter, Spinster family, sphingosine-1-phosphate transporter
MTPPPARGARAALAILTLLNLLNYLDRYVLASLFESLKASELRLTDTQLGSLFTAFLLVYMLASPFFGRLGDRASRPRLLAAGVAAWSLATALGGFARSFAGLFASRAAVGIGEAAYATIAPALLADSFAKERRGRVFAIFFAAIPVGSALGYVLGGLMDRHFGWRAAFFVAGGPGLLLALLCLAIRDPPRGARDGAALLPAGPGGAREAYARLFANRPYRATVAGYAAYTFALGGLAAWTPAFLERVRGLPKADATVQFGAIVVATGLIGTFAGGWIGDRLLKNDRQAYLKLSGWTALAAVPAAAVAFFAPGRVLPMVGIVAAELLLFASTGPINSVIVNVVAPGDRATAVALSILAIHLFGDVPSPPLMGAISDAANLRAAFTVVPVSIAIAGAIWLAAARTADS